VPETDSRSIDAEALIHGVALIPDEHVECRELTRPVRCQVIDTLRDDTVDIVAEYGPRIGDIARIDDDGYP